MKKIIVLIILLIIFLLCILFGIIFSKHVFNQNNSLTNDITSENSNNESLLANNEIILDYENIDLVSQIENPDKIIYKFINCNDSNTIIKDAVYSNGRFYIYIPVTTTDKIDYQLLFKRENRTSINDLIALGRDSLSNDYGKVFEPTTEKENIDDDNAHLEGMNGYGSFSDKNMIVNYGKIFKVSEQDLTDTMTVKILTNINKEIIIIFEKSRKD